MFCPKESPMQKKIVCYKTAQNARCGKETKPQCPFGFLNWTPLPTRCSSLSHKTSHCFECQGALCEIKTSSPQDISNYKTV